MMKLNRGNINEKVSAYLESIRSIALPVLSHDPLVAMHDVKREKLCTGPYPGVSLFEAANRVLSDLVILYGVKRLLEDPVIGSVRLPFIEYEVALGVKGGFDLRATANGYTLVGEAFNVARSFFSTKKSRTVRKLEEEKVDYRLIMFNAEAVKNAEAYMEESDPAMLYLPVETPKKLG
jgi:hypothetical protein